MIQLGKFNDLKVSKAEDSGYTLIDDEGTEIFLPSEKTDKELEEGATVSVFVYPGILGAKKATLKKPLIALGEFAFLTVSSTDEQGVYVDWGMEKDLLIPPKQEGERMEEGESYIIFMYQDRESGKLYGSNKIEKRLSNDDLTIEEGEEVDVMVQRESDMGFAVIVNHEVFQDLLIGDTLKGYVKKIQPENRLDITIRPMGYRNTVDPDVQTVLNALEDNQSFLPLTDKSKPDLIMVELNMSKKAFKRAIGSLYKERKIEIKEDGIHLI
jgi:predicted RNA-binding protein (virulence factor B family)